jgi:sialic acid synthase
MDAPKIVAEIGGNHQGSLETAKQMITVAATFCQVDVVKFQKRCPRESVGRVQYTRPHPNPMHAFGETYGKHREFLEFSAEQHRCLQDFCRGAGVDYSTSVWDMTSAREITPLRPRTIKVPAASNLHFEMLRYLCGDFGGEIHVSLGMTTRAEEDAIVELFRREGRAQDLVLYACTSGYPVGVEDLHLLEIVRLEHQYRGAIKAVGFSGHHLGIAADIAAMTLGARWIERHFTLDRTWKGTDHAASLEPDGMRRLARDARNITKALTYKTKDILDVEVSQRAKLKWLPAAPAPVPVPMEAIPA